jgi:GPI mannosyltransferase 2
MLLTWSIATRLCRGEPQLKGSVAFIAALLYIISPGGIFLSAPYTESTFAAINMFGIRLFLLGKDLHHDRKFSSSALVTVTGGLISGLATVVRSNGVLNGMLYAWEATLCLVQALRGDLQLGRLLPLCLGGILIGAGMILPQYQAYLEYCIQPSAGTTRSWCNDRLPSIFTFVQSHYW